MKAHPSSSKDPHTSPTGYLLLRDGHTVPITGLEPSELKHSAKHLLTYGETPIRHTTRLNAIVHCLGFNGDFGTYTHEHWPQLQALLEAHGCRRQVNLFEPEIRPYLGLDTMVSVKKEAFAARLFSPLLSCERQPVRVFTGYGFDWSEFDELWAQGFRRLSPEEQAQKMPEDLCEARQWLYLRTWNMMYHHSFLSDHLLEHKGKHHTLVLMYDQRDIPEHYEREHGLSLRALEGLRAFLDRRDVGWVRVCPITPRLAILLGPLGTYDLVWRDMRIEVPPALKLEHSGSLKHFKKWYYYEKDRWHEHDLHQAKLTYFAQDPEARLELIDFDHQVLQAHLIEQGRYREPLCEHLPEGLPGTWHEVDLRPDHGLWVSELVTNADFEVFDKETGYFDKLEHAAREDEFAQDPKPFYEAANWMCAPDEPVGVTYHWASAYCRWFEECHGVPARLMLLRDHRAIRPFAKGPENSSHYERLKDMDFPWEHRPPRFIPEVGVHWSTPRFSEPGEDDYVSASGIGSTSLKIWIDQWPPKARLSPQLKPTMYHDIPYLDAWDVYEWCEEGVVAGRYWEGPMGLKSWGEYKNSRIHFRMVIKKGGVA